MTVTPTNIIQSNEYYPFGLQTANSWTRDNNTANNFLANGGTELNATSQLYDLEFSNYDPILGRMHQVDPMAHKYSSLTPYNYSFNSPVVMNDRSGADPFFNRDAWRGALVNNSRLPMDHGTSGSLADYARTIYDDAEAVKNGTMSLDEYAARYGSDPTVQDIATLAGQLWGSPVGNTIASMTYGGLFSFQSNGKTYGGNFVVINGAVQSLAFSFSLETSDESLKGGLVSWGESNIVDVGSGESYESALNGWARNHTDADVTAFVLAGVGAAASIAEDVVNAAKGNLVRLQNQMYDMGARANGYSKGIKAASRVATGLKVTGYGLGAYNAFDITRQYNNGQIGMNGLITEQSSNTFSTLSGLLGGSWGLYGAAWGVGWELGRGITTIPAYQEWRDNTWYPWRNENIPFYK